MHGALGLYLAIARSSFRRYSTYVGATLAGIFTNSVFGVIMCFVYTAVWEANPDAGGYDVTDAVTFVWLGQALLMTVAIWGGGTPDDLAARIKSGDVAIDFYRPVGLLGWYLAGDLGRALYHLLTRGLAPTRDRRAALRPPLPREPGGVAAVPRAAADRGDRELRVADARLDHGVLAPRRHRSTAT